MKIKLLNTSEYAGGAAIACKRLFYALIKNKIEVQLLVQEKNSNESQVINVNNIKLSKYLNLFYILLEKLHFYFFEKNKSFRFAFSTAYFGKKINLKYFQDTDIIHLHWFNLSFLSLKRFKKIIKLKKPVVWTLHDMWSFTGGCHYNDNCENYFQDCGNCKYLKNPKNNDLSNKIHKLKSEIYKPKNITFVTCSQWLADEAKKSLLLKNQNILSIPNPIDTEIYKPLEKIICKQKTNFSHNKFTILFGAASLNDERKGLNFFIEALNILNNNSDIYKEKIEIALFGKTNKELENLIPFKTVNLGYLSETDFIINVYNASDLFITTSLQDNLPNMVMESLACGTPVVAFNIGGIPEMIEHKQNGYLADYKSSVDIAKGIEWILNTDKNIVTQNARQKIINNFTEKIIAEKYQKLYLSLQKN